MLQAPGFQLQQGNLLMISDQHNIAPVIPENITSYSNPGLLNSPASLSSNLIADQFHNSQASTEVNNFYL